VRIARISPLREFRRAIQRDNDVNHNASAGQLLCLRGAIVHRYASAMISARAFVGSNGDEHFSAHVAFAEPGPFCFLNGPRGVSVETAVDWSRRHADSVVVRVGDVNYSAGADAVPGLPPWRMRDQNLDAVPDPPRDWLIRARTVWHRDDRAAIARGMADAIDDDKRTRAVIGKASTHAITLSFELRSRATDDATETASELLRSAWRHLDVDATPGRDYDFSTVELQPL
jgi:hypothetical protein